jgi:hypothetical protein
MNATNETIALEADILKRIAEGLDTKKVDDFLDQLFTLAGRFGSITCNLHAAGVLRLESRGAVLQEAEIARAKTKLRMLCARLAVRCGEWSARPISPYGGVVEFVFPPTKQQFKVRFENTTAVQEIFIETQSGNGAPNTA